MGLKLVRMMKTRMTGMRTMKKIRTMKTMGTMTWRTVKMMEMQNFAFHLVGKSKSHHECHSFRTVHYPQDSILHLLYFA